ncbi:MAG: L,D-transpeptidase family protein [Candidatus Paceibacterota bacterium]
MPRTDDPHPFIHRMRASGMSDTVIQSRLLLEGWPQEVIAPIFDARMGSAPVETSPVQEVFETTSPATSQAPRKYVRVVTVAAALFFLGIFGAFAYQYLQPPVVYSISLPQNNASSTSSLAYGALAALSDPDYYAQVKNTFTNEHTSFIDADLTQMTLTVYVNGTSTLTVPILAKGKVGSWWETPAGIYQIQSKEKNHFSSFGGVYQPWSLDFQGNFFIHGWPYYPDGTPVSTSYSGGCIRLSTGDAEKVYELASVGMPVIVYNAERQPDSFSYQLKAPSVSANEYLVADVTNGTVLASKNASVAAPIASISKLVSALAATEYINLDKTIVVPQSAIVYTSVPRLRAGADVRAYDLLLLMLQESSNEAAETLASSHGRMQFVDYMNDKAKAINLGHTVFSDPSGAKGDYSTPEDLFTLLRYIYDNRRFVFDITAGKLSGSAYGAPEFKNIQNFNTVKNAPAQLIGGKIGQTNEASETYAGVFSVMVGNVERQIAVIVLGSNDATGDVRKFLGFVHGLYAPGEEQAALSTRKIPVFTDQ